MRACLSLPKRRTSRHGIYCLDSRYGICSNAVTTLPTVGGKKFHANKIKWITRHGKLLRFSAASLFRIFKGYFPRVTSSMVFLKLHEILVYRVKCNNLRQCLLCLILLWAITDITLNLHCRLENFYRVFVRSNK